MTKVTEKVAAAWPIRGSNKLASRPRGCNGDLTDTVATAGLAGTAEGVHTPDTADPQITAKADPQNTQRTQKRDQTSTDYADFTDSGRAAGTANSTRYPLPVTSYPLLTGRPGSRFPCARWRKKGRSRAISACRLLAAPWCRNRSCRIAGRRPFRVPICRGRPA